MVCSYQVVFFVMEVSIWYNSLVNCVPCQMLLHTNVWTSLIIQCSFVSLYFFYDILIYELSFPVDSLMISCLSHPILFTFMVRCYGS